MFSPYTLDRRLSYAQNLSLHIRTLSAFLLNSWALRRVTQSRTNLFRMVICIELTQWRTHTYAWAVPHVIWYRNEFGFTNSVQFALSSCKTMLSRHCSLNTNIGWTVTITNVHILCWNSVYGIWSLFRYISNWNINSNWKR